MWKYIKRYLLYCILAALFMIGEVVMDLIQPGFMSKIVDDGVLGVNNNGIGDIQLILKLGLMMIGLVILGGFCGSMNNVFVHFSGKSIGNIIRKDAFKKIMTFCFKQIDDFSTGSLVTRITNDISQVELYISTFVRGLIRTTMLTFGSIFFMFRLNHEFGWMMLGAFPFMLGTMAICMSKATPLFSKLQAELDKINDIMQEDVSGIRIIKACVREIYEKIRFGKANDELIKTQLHVLVIFAFMNPVMNALMYIVIAIILWSGSYQVKSGATTPGVIMAAITYCTQLLNGILILVMLFQNLSKGAASWKRVKEILDCTTDLKDGDFSEDTEIHGQIEFKNVSFRYPNNSQRILKNVNLKINPGETVAIMGATGCGKSSLVNLIPRFYDVTEGEVLVDGIDVKEYNLEFLREKIAITLQKSELFSQTIEENIAWGKLNATDNEIRQMAKIAQADDFISKTENQYQTLVAERGMSLSGGQKQRISISRAILKASEFLIFDDSTSALDLKTEANLYEALQKEYPDMTKIMIAQRIASVRKADKIVVFENGEIVAIGTHQELLENCKVYQDIYDSQNGKEGDEFEN